MPRPVVSADTEIWYASIGRAADGDEDLGWPLLTFLESMGSQLQAIDDVVRDDPGGDPGWSVILDLNRISDKSLAYLGQFVGVETLSSLTADENRVRISVTGGFRRGTPAALRAAAQQFMTGTKTVRIFEREGGAYRFRVRTFTAETPDPAAVTAALLAQKPAGLLMTVEVAVGLSYAELDGRYTDSADMVATGMTYSDLQFLT